MRKYVLIDKKVEVFFKNVFQRKLQSKKIVLSKKYVCITDNKNNYICKNELGKNDVLIDYQTFLQNYYNEVQNIVIEKNIPIPNKKKHYSMFPFEIMSVGDSFLVTKKELKKTSLLQLKHFLWGKAREYIVENDINAKFSFHFERENDGVRVFKI